MNNKIRICISAYFNGLPKRVDAAFSCVYSILCQTYENFEIYIHHDGPVEDKTLKHRFQQLSNKVVFIDDLDHKGHCGFYHRHKVSLMGELPDWVVYTNEDNYYSPVFLERMLNTAISCNSKMVICDMVCWEFNYNVLVAHPRLFQIDMGAFMSHIDLIKDTPWTDFDSCADGKYAEKIASKTNPVKAPGVLFVHN